MKQGARIWHLKAGHPFVRRKGPAIIYNLSKTISTFLPCAAVRLDMTMTMRTKDLHGEQEPDKDVSVFDAVCPRVMNAISLLLPLLWWQATYIEQSDEHVPADPGVVDGDSSTPLYLYV